MTSNCGDSNRSTRLPSTLVLPVAERGEPSSLCLSLELMLSRLLTLTLLPELNGTMTSNCGDSNRSTRLPSTLVLPAAERGDLCPSLDLLPSALLLLPLLPELNGTNNNSSTNNF